MVILTHLKRQGGAKTHHTHDLSNHERISQCLKKTNWFWYVEAANTTREIIGTFTYGTESWAMKIPSPTRKLIGTTM